MLRGLNQAHAVRIFRLDGCGQPDGEPVELQAGGQGWRIDLDSLKPNVWHLLEVER